MLLSSLLLLFSQILLIQGCPFLINQQQLLATNSDVNNLPADHHGRQLQGPPPPPGGPPPPPPSTSRSTIIPSSSPTYSSTLRSTISPSSSPTYSSTSSSTIIPSSSPTYSSTSRSTISPSSSPTYSSTSRSPSALVSTPSSPFCIKTGGLAPNYTQAGVCAAYIGIKTAFYSQLPTDPFALSDIFGQSIRLAFHDAAEADVTKSSDLMGPDGCISNSASNNGLIESTSYVTTLLEPIWQTYCDSMSRGDFWSLIGILAVQKADPSQTISIPFQYGRVDRKDCSAGADRLPNAQLGSTGLTQTFVTQLGLTLNDAGHYITLP